MDVQVVASEMAKVPEVNNGLKENGNQADQLIKFGSQGDEPVRKTYKILCFFSLLLQSERAEIINPLKALHAEGKQYKMILDEKKKEMAPLQDALSKLRDGRNADSNSSGICSSEEEFNNLIRSLQYHMQHETIMLSWEKEIIREIKQLEGTREKVIANAGMRAKIQDSLGQKDL